MRPTRSDFGWAAATLVGVPALTVLLGGRLTYEGTFAMTILLAGLVFLRRRWPIAVLIAGVGTVVGYRTAGLIDVGWIWPATAALFTVAAGRVRHGLAWAVGTGIGVLVLAGYGDWQPVAAAGHRPISPVWHVAMEALWLAVVVAIARAYRNSHGWRRETIARAEATSQRKAAEERLLMAQELHDVVAHTLTVVGVQLRVAQEAMDNSPQDAREALRVAQEVRGKAVADLRSLVNILRERQPLAPPGDLMALAGLVSGTRSDDLDIVLDLEGDPGAVPAAIAVAAYRIVQEALTNVVRHATASRARVTVRCAPDQVLVEVVDNGAATGEIGVGHGIAGMRERVAVIGGVFSAGRAPGGGFRVSATLPVRS